MSFRFTVSIDVDSIDCYYRIHGLGDSPREHTHTVILRALPRFAEIFEQLGITPTWFLVGQDFDRNHEQNELVMRSRSLLQHLVEKGHEIGNHSYHHHYDLARRDNSVVTHEIEHAHHVLSELAGRPIEGFRAPGYDLSASMAQTVRALGYVYDSSLFPAPGYYLAKASVMAGLALLGRPSGAVMTNPRALACPPEPYWMDVARPWRKNLTATSASLREIPIAVSPILRVPLIGTSLLLAPSPLRKILLRAAVHREFFNFELHGIDLCDKDEDRLPAALVERQPDLKLSLLQKQDRLRGILEYLLKHGSCHALSAVAREMLPT